MNKETTEKPQEHVSTSPNNPHVAGGMGCILVVVMMLFLVLITAAIIYEFVRYEGL